MSAISLLGCSTSVALTMGPTDEKEEEALITLLLLFVCLLSLYY